MSYRHRIKKTTWKIIRSILPQKQYTGLLRLSIVYNTPTDIRRGELTHTFHSIYKKNLWGSCESVSGPGSEIENTEKLRAMLPKIYDKYSIHSVLDAPCGDYNWMRIVQKPEQYIGGDIICDLIEQNQDLYGDEYTQFIQMDITKDDIPCVDLILCKDCVQHLGMENIKKTISNFIKSGSKYLLINHYPWTLRNYDIPDGEFNTLNLSKAPFKFPKPLLTFDATYEGSVADNHFCLYQLSSL